MKDTELRNNTLLILLDKNGRKTKEKETHICELERMATIGTMTYFFPFFLSLLLFLFSYYFTWTNHTCNYKDGWLIFSKYRSYLKKGFFFVYHVYFYEKCWSTDFLIIKENVYAGQTSGAGGRRCTPPPPIVFSLFLIIICKDVNQRNAVGFI